MNQEDEEERAKLSAIEWAGARNADRNSGGTRRQWVGGGGPLLSSRSWSRCCGWLSPRSASALLSRKRSPRPFRVGHGSVSDVAQSADRI